MYTPILYDVYGMEKARAYKMKLEAMKRQGERTDLTSDQLGRKLETAALVGEKGGDSRVQVRRYIRLNNLIPELQDMVDENTLKFNPAVEISYLSPEEQQDFYEYISSMSCTPSLSQAQKLKAASKEDILSVEKLEDIMTAQPPSVAPREPQLTVPMSKVRQYFPKNFTNEQMTDLIVKLVQNHFRSRNGQNR